MSDDIIGRMPSNLDGKPSPVWLRSSHDLQSDTDSGQGRTTLSNRTLQLRERNGLTSWNINDFTLLKQFVAALQSDCQ